MPLHPCAVDFMGADARQSIRPPGRRQRASTGELHRRAASATPCCRRASPSSTRTTAPRRRPRRAARRGTREETATTSSSTWLTSLARAAEVTAARKVGQPRPNAVLHHVLRPGRLDLFLPPL